MWKHILFYFFGDTSLSNSHKIRASVGQIVSALIPHNESASIAIPLRDLLGRTAHRDYLDQYPPEQREQSIKATYHSKVAIDLEIHGRMDLLEANESGYEITEFKTVIQSLNSANTSHTGLSSINSFIAWLLL